MKQHSYLYKLSAVMYYKNHNEDLRDTCDILNVNINRWIVGLKDINSKETLVEKHAKIIC